jgi:hypothetical protein
VQKILLALGTVAPAKNPIPVAKAKKHSSGAGRTVSFIAKLTAVSGTRKIASAQARLLTTRAR